jgi:hypothetical protein
MLRKYILTTSGASPAQEGEIPIHAVATIFVTSESIDHPIDYAFDSQRGPGATRWIAAQSGEQSIIVAFDRPQTVHHVHLEIEEPETNRTQELQLALSTDWGRTYRELRRQEYNFNPDNTTFEHEDWAILEQDVTHLRLCIKPDKGGKACRASLTSLAVR